MAGAAPIEIRRDAFAQRRELGCCVTRITQTELQVLALRATSEPSASRIPTRAMICESLIVEPTPSKGKYR
jgi:hypothetical protein